MTHPVTLFFLGVSAGGALGASQYFPQMIWLMFGVGVAVGGLIFGRIDQFFRGELD